jgi:alanyl-tRNA synthetase
MYSGHDIFKMVDTYGFPLDIIVLELRDNGQHFNVAQFIESAVKAGWKKIRIVRMLGVNAENERVKELIEKYTDYYLGV